MQSACGVEAQEASAALCPPRRPPRASHTEKTWDILQLILGAGRDCICAMGAAVTRVPGIMLAAGHLILVQRSVLSSAAGLGRGLRSAGRERTRQGIGSTFSTLRGCHIRVTVFS